jgi:L-iditol 2-dehydrogenase
MKVAKLYSFNNIRIEDIPVPEIGPNDALIKTKACGICSGDVMKWYIERKAPLVLGHEPTGEIVEIGSSLINHHSSLSIGDRVFTHHHASCLNCIHCKKGNYVHCKTWKNSKIIPGGISEYILIPEINLKNDTLKLPENVSYEDGTLIEPLACVLKGLKRAIPHTLPLHPPSHPPLIRGDKGGLYPPSFTVLILGLGVMGLLNLLILKKLGAGKIIGADMVQYRLNKAKEFGADEVVDISKENLRESIKRITDNYMADLVIVCPNSVEAMEEGILCAGAGGTVLFFTPAKPDEKLTIDPNHLYFNDINVVTSYSCGAVETREALSFIEDGVVRAEKLVTHKFPIEKTAEAFKLVAEAKESLKVVIVFE